MGASLPTPKAQLGSCVGSLREKHQISRQCRNLGSKPQSDAGLDPCSPAGCGARPAAAAGDGRPGVSPLYQRRPAEPAALGALGSCDSELSLLCLISLIKIRVWSLCYIPVNDRAGI